MKSLFKIFIIIYLVILIVGCAANRRRLDDAELKNQAQIPAGVDSLLAVKADSLADMLFVDHRQKVKATHYYLLSKKYFDKSDSLWRLYQNFRDSSLVMTTEDTNFAVKYYQNCRYFLKLKSKKSQQQILPGIKEVKKISITLCRGAKSYADSANLANPFDLSNRANGIQISMMLGKLSSKKRYYADAINKLKDFLTFEKSQHEIYRFLGECYYALSDWENAFQNFQQAQKVFERTIALQNLDSQPAYFDSTIFVYYLYQQGDSKAKLYDDKNALRLLEQALLFSYSPQKKEQIQNYIDWINWDAGNIRAVERRDQIYTFYQQEKYKKANKEFKKLLKILKTQSNKDLINWRIATIDFEILNKKNDGIERMFHVISSLNLADSVYLNDYGAMCYSLGLDYLKKKEYKIAYAYFNQAAKVDWEKRGASYLQLAQLSQSDPAETIQKCRQALVYEDRLSLELLNQTYRLLADAYKRNGDFELARQYDEQSGSTTF